MRPTKFDDQLIACYCRLTFFWWRNLLRIPMGAGNDEICAGKFNSTTCDLLLARGACDLLLVRGADEIGAGTVEIKFDDLIDVRSMTLLTSYFIIVDADATLAL
jgi:hypothetical protein